MPEVRKGRQTPTKSIILPYTETRGQEAIELYNSSGRTAQEWQELLIHDILAINEDGLWVHTKFGEEVPRRNGKNEIVVIRKMWGLEDGEKILHTAHRTTTSTSASRRLAERLVGAGYEEVERPKRGTKYDKHFTYTKQKGLERIVLLCEGGGSIDFRTRSSSGGLGEGFDLLIIDEAQEYTDNQATALKYVVTAIISSGVRCEKHNANVGGVANSRHLYGKAMDFRIVGRSAAEVLTLVKARSEISYCYAIDGNFVHMDVE